MNEGLDYPDRIKPANFLLIAHPHSLDGSGLKPVAAYESDATKWEDMRWLDRNSGASIKITTEPSDGMVRLGVVRVLTYRDVLTKFWTHPEAKSLGSKGEKVGRESVGLLKTRTVQASPNRRHIGKEGNKLEERELGLLDQNDDVQLDYVDPYAWRWQLDALVTVLGVSLFARQIGVHRGTVGRWLSGNATPQQRQVRRINQRFASGLGM